MTDEALLDRAVRGNDAAFAALYERHRDPLFAWAWRLAVLRLLLKTWSTIASSRYGSGRIDLMCSADRSFEHTFSP